MYNGKNLIKFMRESKTRGDWRLRKEAVIDHHGCLPDEWMSAIVDSGLGEEVLSQFDDEWDPVTQHPPDVDPVWERVPRVSGHVTKHDRRKVK